METGRALDLVAPPPAAREPFTLFEIAAPEMARGAWQIVLPLIEKACAKSHSDYTPERVAEDLYHQRTRFLALMDGAEPVAIAVVAIEGPVLFVNLFGGEGMNEWADLEPSLREYAADLGCASVRGVMRKGLAKKMTHWKLLGYVMEIAV